MVRDARKGALLTMRVWGPDAFRLRQLATKSMKAARSAGGTWRRLG
ncbi:hypothetical protein [Bradyrhizobium hipponense]|nr:hypothetical protein [Bradyrhizobium hipponense]